VNRRELLTGAAALLAMAAASPAFAGVSPAKRRQLLSAAWKRAVAGRRALLVVVIPANDGEWSDRGDSLGIWLNHASDEDLSHLSGTEPVCATLDEIDRLVPGVRAAKEAWFVLVHLEEEAPTWRSIVVPKPRADPLPDYSEWLSRQPDPSRPEPWRDYMEDGRNQGEGVIRAIEEAYRGSLIRALVSEQVSPGVSADGTEVGRNEWVRNAPPGAHWGHTAGCGVFYEGVEDNALFGCGMGYVPYYAGRFLAFWDVEPT
jgi:hypothetical protein